MNSNKKIKFNEDGTTQTIYQEIRETALECKDVSSLADTNASSRDTCSAASRAEKSKIRKKRKFEKLNAIENVYLKEKFGGNEMNLNKKEGDLEVGSKSITENLDKEMEKIDNPATAVTTESKAKTAALHYLDTFTKDKANWKFQKVRQVWILQNMYFSKQMNNEQFKDCKWNLDHLSDLISILTIFPFPFAH